ncbi:efflux RND transporter periplasmic adaptor subunit [Galbibacter sp. BG1]|uniref:efflux RND transporter periplasmic adaptor subunit n=1 Tax=Galbibacter sp. BG1 TaxID=1170699 RepID=UPI0015B9FD52|nr:efflux RND transporter periplasmic adaptor subunit [Galbibacter sp. BG1]QLE02854.1 efflux RND transporter periplasmic adaptor subunit [Galbibacter sp. BG1]
MKNLNRYLVFALCIFLFGLTACENSESKVTEKNEDKSDSEKKHPDQGIEIVMLTAKQFEALQMNVDSLSKRNMSGYVEANGHLEVPPQNEARITTVVGANVVSIEVIEGDKVEKGQTVAYLSHPNIIQKQTDYLNAYSDSQFLKKEFERQKKLYDAGVGSGANFQKAEAEYQSSQSRLNGLDAQLKQLNVNTTQIKKGSISQRVALQSPIEGYVQKVKVKTGQYVEPHIELMEIVDTHHIHADLMVFEKDVHKVKKGQKVAFSVQSNRGDELIAEIYSVGKTFEENPKAIHVHAEIKNKEGHDAENESSLIPGMYIQGRIQTDSSSTVAVPESAIASDGNKSFVFSVKREDENWFFTPQEVVLKAKDGGWWAIDFLKEQSPKMVFAMNNAYYLMAELKKGEAAHSH